MELKDRVIVVTGAARGIGRALAARFHAEDARAVVMADIDGARVEQAAHEVGASAIQCDVSHEADVERLVEHVESTHGRIDVFCSNAGIAIDGGPEASDDDWQRIWNVNVMSHVFVARHVLPGMLARKEGYLVGTVSAAGLLIDFFTAGALEPDAVAVAVVKGIADERFLILPHPEVAEYFRRKADDYDRWLRGMRRLRSSLLATAD